MKKIANLELGEIDARYYLDHPHAPQTEFFKRSFYRSDHLAKLHDPKIYFYIGEKGTGKTSYSVFTLLFLQAEHKASSTFFDADDFSRFVSVAEAIGTEQNQYAEVWNFIFCLLLLDSLVEKYGIEEPNHIRAAVQAARTILLGSHVNSISRALSVAVEAETFFGVFAGGAGLSLPNHIVESAKPVYKLSRVVDMCLSDLEKLKGDVQLSLFIGSIDVRPESLDYPLYLKVVSSICTGSWVLNATQLSRVPPSLKIVLMLRPDIFEAVPFQNRGAKLDIHSHLIDWTTRYNKYRDSDIFKFTDYLLFVQQNDKEKLRQGDAWSHYFPFTVESRKFEKGDDPFILFLRHSFYKPRDIVKYLDLMQQAYSLDSRGEKDQFSEDVFFDKDIRKRYSDYLLQEIQDQTSYYYSMAEWQQFKDFADGYLSSRISMRTRVFEYDEFVAAHRELIEYNARNRLTTPQSFQTSDTLLQLMFDLNIIGYYEEKVLKSGDKRIFTNYSFRQRSFSNLKPKIPTGARYVMHYGLARALFTGFG